MTRTEARESVMQMFFQMETQMDFSVAAKQTYIEHYIPESDQLEYVDQVYEAYAAHSEDVDTLIEDASRGWKLERITFYSRSHR